MPYMSGYEAPPPPTLKVVREWEGVGVWPDATPPPPPPGGVGPRQGKDEVATSDFVPMLSIGDP